MKKNGSLLFILVLVFTTLFQEANANIIHVPTDYSTIQSAILASAGGDTVEVSPGIYFENINLRGRNILLTSQYYLNQDTSYICSTVINGSQPVYPDTASCIIINSGEDATAIIQGFTITGGAGTKWLDVHGAGIFREGGGILVEFSSPTIRNNHIIYNTVTNTTGVVSTGGGGIRCGDGSPVIDNNLIAYNEGRYGGGVVFNYCFDAYLRNNLIAHNSGGQSYGGGGVWATGSNTASIVYIENNTIANNHVSGSGAYGGKGGGIFVFSVSLNARNNIIWGNTQVAGNSAVSYTGGVITVEYSDMDFNIAGTGNFNADPLFMDTISFLLSPISPCIDLGDPATAYNDLTASPNTAVFPSQGNERNDMGVYGGPLAIVLAVCADGTSGITEDHDWNTLRVYPNPVSDVIKINSPLHKIQRIELYSVGGRKVNNMTANGFEAELSVKDLAPGMYFIRVISNNLASVKKIEID